MNKSKFLKKSLAMVLAVMLVVAMIPLGASAAPGQIVVNDGTVLTITTAVGTLDKSTWTDTVAYDAVGDETLTIALDPTKGYDTITATVTDAEGEETEQTDNSAPLEIKVPVTAKQVVFYASKEDTKSASYTVKMNKPAASNDLTVKSAKIGEIEGTVNNPAKTIEFKVPWGYNGPWDVTVEQNFPGTIDPATPTAVAGTDVTFKSFSQVGNSDTYTIKTTEMDCISGITVAGTAAVWDKETKKYTVTLPEGTKLDDPVSVSYFAVSNGSLKIDTSKNKWNTAAFKNGEKVTVNAGDNTVEFTSTANTTKSFTVNVTVAKSNDATIKSFTATATNDKGDAYKENGTVTDKELTVVLPYKSDLTDVDLEIEVAEGASVVTGLTGLNLSDGKKVLIDVVAEDGKTHKYYELSATAAPNPYGDPKITGVVLTIDKDGDDEADYKGTVSDKTITFLVPYATSADKVTDGDYTWEKSFATNLGAPTFGTDPFKDANEVQITSDSGETATYTLVFKKEAAKTGKTVSGVSLSTAATSDKVTADNTYNVTVSGTKATVSLPYSFQNETTTALHATFTVPEGAALYFNDFAGTAANLNTTPFASGYNADDAESNPKEPKNTITVADLIKKDGDDKFTTKIVVADETAKVLLANAVGSVALADLETGDYKGHVTIYDIEPKFAAAETGHTLTALTANKGLVTSKISGNTIEITVPYSYRDGSKTFYADYTASKLATVTYGGVTLPSEIPDAAGATGELKVVADGEGYKLQVFDGTWKDASAPAQIIVENEAQTATTPYTVTVKVAPAETGADVTSLKINNTVATINKTARTITASLPYGTDLASVTMEYEISKLAEEDVEITPTTVDDVDYYDVSEPFTITVTAEDGKTTKVYTVTATANQQFSDVKDSDYFHDDVYAAAAAGIVKGNDKGQFLPRTNVTRRDFALMIVRMLGVEDEAKKYTTTTFTDVAKTDYALGAIAYCAENGIINGDGKGHFMPGSAITREAAAQMTAKALKLTLGTTSTEFKDDASISSWAKAAVAACAKEGIIKGSNGNYMPKANIQRCDAAAILVRALNK